MASRGASRVETFIQARNSDGIERRSRMRLKSSMESLRTDARLWVIGFRLAMHYGAKGESILTAHQHSPPRHHRRLTQLGGHPPLRTHRSAIPLPSALPSC
jgi:hypothetical protein